MRYIIYQVVLAGGDNFPANRHNDPVYQQATVRMIELGFGGINNDFASEQAALDYINSHDELKGMNLTIMSHIRRF